MIEAPEPPHHHHHKTGMPWFDFILPIAVICISVASLLTSLQSERSMRALVEQNSRLVSAQSTPLLMLDTGNEKDGRHVLDMTISNVGTGPAQIAWFHLTDAQGHDASGGALTEKVMKLDPQSLIATQQISSMLLRSGAERLVFSWPRPSDQSAALAAWNNLDHTRFSLHAKACYCSIFEECKITEFGDSVPRPVASCSQPQDDLRH